MKNINEVFNSPPQKSKEEDDLYKWKKVAYSKDEFRSLKKMLYSKRPKRTKAYTQNENNFSGGKGFQNENEKMQRVTFKMSFSDSKSAHEAYLKKYMPQENKKVVEQKPTLFGTPKDEYEENEVDEHFKCIISPENQNVDLRILTSEFVKRLELLTGYKFYWQAAIHEDTEHRHSHLCINGIDKNGKKVRFPKEMIKRTMRETLSFITTQIIGERTQGEIEAARKNLTSAKRWTKLDDAISLLGNRISRENLNAETESRLAFLSKMGLAKFDDKSYTLKNDWQEVLTATGRYNTFFTEWQKSGGKLELYGGGRVYGIVENVITFDKDESWNDAIIVRQGEKLIYVPIWQLHKTDIIGKKINIKEGVGNRSLSRQISDKDIFVYKDNTSNEQNEY